MKKKKTAKKKTIKPKSVKKKSNLKNDLEKDFLNLFIDENLSEYNLKVDQFNQFKNADKRRKYEYEGKKYSYKTLYNKLLNDAVKINTVISESENRIGKKEREEKFRLKKGEKVQTIFFTWQSDSIKDEIYDNNDIDTVNGIDIENNLDEIIDLLDSMKLGGTSSSVIIFSVNYKTRKARVTLLSGEEAEKYK